jgi:hypothetical protein
MSTDNRHMKKAFILLEIKLSSGVDTTCEEAMAIASGMAAFAKWCHEAQVAAGWWTDIRTGERIVRNRGQLIALMHSEVSEGLEADRKSLMDDKLPHRKGLEVELGDLFIRMGDFVGHIASGPIAWGVHVSSLRRDMTPDEKAEDQDHFASIHAALSYAYAQRASDYSCMIALAAAAQRAVALAWERRLDLWGAIEEKMRYNAQRADHKIENRAKTGGKAY